MSYNINLNQKGTRYFGCGEGMLPKMIQEGIRPQKENGIVTYSPFSDEFISISESGWKSDRRPSNRRSREIAQGLVDVGAASFQDGMLEYKDGYQNSITCILGWGPFPNYDKKRRWELFLKLGIIPGIQLPPRVTLVFSREVQLDYVTPESTEKADFFDYASLHPTVKDLDISASLGIIVEDTEQAQRVQKLIQRSRLKRPIFNLEGSLLLSPDTN